MEIHFQSFLSMSLSYHKNLSTPRFVEMPRDLKWNESDAFYDASEYLNLLNFPSICSSIACLLSNKKVKEKNFNHKPSSEKYFSFYVLPESDSKMYADIKHLKRDENNETSQHEVSILKHISLIKFMLQIESHFRLFSTLFNLLLFIFYSILFSRDFWLIDV